jgi:hypothetical protein
MPQLWSLLLGARHVRPGVRRFSRADDTLLQKITAEHFPQGYTILEASGGWFDPDKKRFIREQSRQILVSADSPRPIGRWARALGIAFHQKELLICQLGRMHTITALQRNSRRISPSKPSAHGS